MKKASIFLIILLLVSPAAYAFSFSDVFDFLGDIFLSEDKITGNAAKGKEGGCASSGSACGGRNPSCCNGLSCVSGTCQTPAVCGNGNVEGSEECDDGGSNTNTPCSADYGSSCTYCDTSCSSHTVTGASCGDGNCDNGNEDCSSCETDCGVCVTFDNAPSLSLSVLDFTAGSSGPTISVTNGVKCSYSIFEFSSSEASTRRGAATRKVEIVVNEPIDCDSVQSDITSELNYLPSGSYELKVDAKNNQGTTSELDTFDITGGSITITTPKISYTYSLTDPPLANVDVSGKPKSCSWSINGGSATSFNCGSGLSDFDISTYSNDGVNTLNIVVGSVTSKRDYLYYETASLVGQIKVTESGARGGSGDYGILIGGESGVEDASVTLALWAAKQNLVKKGGMSRSNADEILSVLTSDSELAKKIAAVQETVGTTDFAVLPTTRVTEIKAGSAYTSQIAVYNSRKVENFITTSTDPETHELIIEKSGSRVTVTLHSDPVTFDLEYGECKDVDMNADEIADIIVCYEEGGDVTVNNLVTVDDSIEDEYTEDTTVVSPVTITMTKIYELPFDEESSMENILKTRYYPIVLTLLALVIVLSVFSIKFLLSTKKKTKKRRKN